MKKEIKRLLRLHRIYEIRESQEQGRLEEKQAYELIRKHARQLFPYMDNCVTHSTICRSYTDRELHNACAPNNAVVYTSQNQARQA